MHTKERLAQQILTDIVSKWENNGMKSCPHCGKHDDLDHLNWCLFQKWLDLNRKTEYDDDSIYLVMP